MFSQPAHLKSFMEGTPSAYISLVKTGWATDAREASKIGVCVCVCLIYVEQTTGSITKEKGATRSWVGN